MTDFTTWTDDFLIKTAHGVMRTMLDVEEGRQKLAPDAIRQIALNANAMIDELERRDLGKRFASEALDGLAQRMNKRGIK